MSKELIRDVVAAYGFRLRGANQLQGNVNIVYHCFTDRGEMIVRFTPAVRRARWEVEGEAQFMKCLAEHTPYVPDVYSTPSKELVISYGDQYHIICLEKAEGDWLELDRWRDTSFYQMGKMIGKLHAVTKELQLTSHISRRHWDQEDLAQWDLYVPTEQIKVREKIKTLINRIRSFPKDPANYGLIHNDIHFRNFVVSPSGKFQVFDFEDSCYNYFLYDIAVSLYSFLKRHSRKEQALTRRFLSAFFRGYQTETDLTPSWKEQLPYFLQLRRALIYVFYCMDDQLPCVIQEKKQLIDQMKEDIEQERPIGMTVLSELSF